MDMYEEVLDNYIIVDEEPEFVQEVDTEKGVFVTPIEGMFYEI